MAAHRGKRAEAGWSLGVGGYEVTEDANGSEVEPAVMTSSPQ